MKTYEIERIRYKRKEIDRGIILGQRPYKWTLGNRYSPCHAKIDGRLVSKCSPHRRNFTVYIPADLLEIGHVIHITCKEYKGQKVLTQVLIRAITSQYVECDLIAEDIEKPDYKPIVHDYMILTNENSALRVFGGSEDHTEDEQYFESEEDFTENLKELCDFFENIAKEEQAQALAAQAEPEPPKPERLCMVMKERNPQKSLNLGVIDLPLFCKRLTYSQKPQTATAPKPIPIKVHPVVQQPVKGLSPAEIAILSALRAEKTLDADILLTTSKLTLPQFFLATVSLELAGMIKQKAGRLFTLTPKGGSSAYDITNQNCQV